MVHPSLGFYSIWAFVVLLLVSLAVASLPLLKVADIPPTQRHKRLWNMDGLRGFLALAVVAHHTAIYHLLLIRGIWEDPPSRFFAVLGPVGVSMFFMITGFLFWSALLRQSGKPDWAKLYLGRVFRIGPLYLTAVLVVFLYVFAKTHFSLHVGRVELLEQVLQWLSLGILATTDLNGFQNTFLLLAGVTWSIQWEWWFYLSLPLLALAAKKGRNDLFLILPGLVLSILGRSLYPKSTIYAPSPVASLIALFFLGMLGASLKERGIVSRLSDRTNSMLFLLLLAAVFVWNNPYRNAPTLLLGAAFFLICSGTSVFGLLLSRPARRLGDISYGIYLLQGLVLGAVYHPTAIKALAVLSPAYHWLFGIGATILLILLATMAHAMVELPGINAGRRVAQNLAEKRNRLTATPSGSPQ